MFLKNMLWLLCSEQTTCDPRLQVLRADVSMPQYDPVSACMPLWRAAVNGCICMPQRGQ